MNLDTLLTKTITGACPCVIGLDSLPENCFENNDAVLAYNIEVINAVYDVIPALSLNIGTYLPFGTEVISKTISYAKEKGMYVIADAKCSGDASASVLAELYFDTLDADAVTLCPYFGEAGLMPFLEKCRTGEKAVFVVSHSDTEGVRDVQELMAGLRSVYRAICEKVAMWGDKLCGNMGYSSVGLMLGGLANSTLSEIRRTHKKTPFLLTGYNGSSIEAHDLSGAFDMKGLGGLVYVSSKYFNAEKLPLVAENIHKSAEAIKRELAVCF